MMLHIPRSFAIASWFVPVWRSLGAVAPVVLMLLGACSAYPRVTKPPLKAPPGDAIWLQGTGGVQLYAALRMPNRAVRGIIFFVLGPEIAAAEPYPHFSAAAHAAGFLTAVVHPRGTGYSEGLRGDIDNYDLFVDDLRLGLAYLRQRYPAIPIFLFGHSAGAALALELAAMSQPAPAGLILVNPAYKRIYSEGMGPSFSDYVVFAWNYLFRPAALTVDMNANPSVIRYPADRAEAEAMQRDPLVVRYFSMRFLAAHGEVLDRCADNAAATKAPMLLIQGAHDVLVDPAGNDEILAMAGTADKTKRIAAHGGHGSSAVETMVDVLMEWLEAHCQ